MKQYRLVTRADLDGIISAVLLKKINLINEIKFVHPKDMQDGLIDITENDIITNLPYSEEAHFVFDHHYTEDIRCYGRKRANHIINPVAKSASRVIFEYFGGVDKFPKGWDNLLDNVDKADSGSFTEEEILRPNQWCLLNYILDPRTGLGRFDNQFRLKNFEFIRFLIDFMQDKTNINDIMEQPDVKERVRFFFNEANEFKKQLLKCTTEHGYAVVVDLRKEPVVHVGNRFMVYALYPKCNISVHCIRGFNPDKTVFAVGKSILNHTSNINVGDLMAEYGGGGHRNAGTCQVDNDKADEILERLTRILDSAL